MCLLSWECACIYTSVNSEAYTTLHPLSLPCSLYISPSGYMGRQSNKTGLLNYPCYSGHFALADRALHACHSLFNLVYCLLTVEVMSSQSAVFMADSDCYHTDCIQSFLDAWTLLIFLPITLLVYSSNCFTHFDRRVVAPVTTNPTSITLYVGIKS